MIAVEWTLRHRALTQGSPTVMTFPEREHPHPSVQSMSWRGWRGGDTGYSQEWGRRAPESSAPVLLASLYILGKCSFRWARLKRAMAAWDTQFPSGSDFCAEQRLQRPGTMAESQGQSLPAVRPHCAVSTS